MSQAGRAQLLKQHAVAGGTAVVAVSSSGAAAALQPHTKTITRTVSEAEMNAILRRQQQGKAGTQLAAQVHSHFYL